MAKDFLQFGPFMGVVASLDPEMIPDNSAADLRNVLVEDGKIRPRYGYRALAQPPAGFQSNVGFDYVQGFDANNNLTEEYISFDNDGAGILPYSVNVRTGVRTPITNKGAQPNFLTNPTYGSQPGLRSVSFNNFSYSISPNDAIALYQHTVGEINTWVPMTPPPAPTAAPVIQIQAYFIDGNNPSTTQMRWDNGSPLSTSAVSIGVPPGGSNVIPASPMDVNGNLFFVLVKDSGPQDLHGFTITISLTGPNGPGAQDWTYADRMILYIESPWTPVSGAGGSIGFDSNAFTVTVTNAAGQAFQPTTITPVFDYKYWGNGGPGTGEAYWLILDFADKLPRSDWQNMVSFQVGFAIENWPDTFPIGGNVNIPFGISRLNIGQVDSTPYDDEGLPSHYALGYTFYDTNTGLESPISPTVILNSTQLNVGGAVHDANSNKDYRLNARAKIYLPAPPAGVGQQCDYRLYARRSGDAEWFLIYDPGQAATTPAIGLIKQNSYDNRKDAQGREYGDVDPGAPHTTLNGVAYTSITSLRISWAELSLSSAFSLGLGQSPFKNLVCAAAYKGWMVWGFRGGFQNLQHSAIGNELVLYNNSDLTLLSPTNTSAPAAFTLADNGSDDPVAMFPLGQALVILGSNGVYAQTGYSPTTMSPPWRLPTALGCLGQYACCEFHDDLLGNPGVVFVSRNGEGVYMVQEDLTYTSQTHFKVTELTLKIRGLLQSFLATPNASTPNALSSLRMGVDWTKDALWIINGNKALVYRRPSMLDQERHWELYQWNLAGATVQNIAFTTKWRMRWVRSTGQIDENEWNSSLQSYMSGLTQDGGLAITPCYFTTKKKTTPNVIRVNHVEVDRELLTDTPSITVASTRETNTIQTAAGKYNVRFPVFQQGREHQLTLTLPDGSQGIRRVLVETYGPLGDRWRS